MSRINNIKPLGCSAYFYLRQLFAFAVLVSLGCLYSTAQDVEASKGLKGDAYFWSQINASIPTVLGKKNQRQPRGLRTSRNVPFGGAGLVPKSVFILQGILDDYEHGLTAGGVHQGFGINLGEFGLSTIPGSNGQFSAILATIPGGFTGRNDEETPDEGAVVLNNFIGFSKTFDNPINGIGADGNPNFSHIAYLVHSPNPVDENGMTFEDNTRFFVSEIVIGDGGANGGSGSIWVETAPPRTSLGEPNDGLNPVSTRPKLSEFSNGFTRRIIPLVPNQFPGYVRVAGQGDFDLGNITQIIFLLLRWDQGGTDATRTVFFDDIALLNPPYDLEVDTSPVSNLPITAIASMSDEFSSLTPIFQPGFGDSEAVTLTVTQASTTDENGALFNFDHWEINGVDQPTGQVTTMFSMFRDTRAIAVYEANNFIFSVESMAEGIEISGLSTSISGVKDFTAEINENTMIQLTAMEHVPTDDGTFYFIQWEFDDGSVSPSSTISLQINNNMSVEAIYELRHELVVNSANIPGFSITGTHPNTTSYSESLLSGSLVSLDTDDQIVKGFKYRFSRWVRDGSDEPIGSTTINFTLNQNTTLMAEFVHQHDLDIVARDQGNLQSIPNVLITGTHTGTTEFGVSVDTGTNVTLTAPLLHMDGAANETFRFIQWNLEGQGTQNFNQQSIDITIDSDITAIAEYARGDFLLTVVSIPIKGVDFGSDGKKQEGATNYNRVIKNGDPVVLKAPKEIFLPTATLSFNHWNLIFETKPMTQLIDENISFSISEDTMAVACYDPIFALEPGWNLIATPMEHFPSNVRQVLPTNDTLWKWGRDTFETTKEISPGSGYWAFSTDKVIIKTGGKEPKSSKVSLDFGWNLIGVKGYQLITASSSDQYLQLPPNSRIASDVWGWNNKLQQFYPITDINLELFEQDVMFPSYGYWVYVTNL